MNRKKIKRSQGDLEIDIALDEFLVSVLNDLTKNGIPVEKAVEIWAIGIENYLLFRAITKEGETVQFVGKQIRRGNG